MKYTDDPLRKPPKNFALWGVFMDKLFARFRRGEVEYGDKSFEREPRELIGEIQEELLDVCNWSFILWTRLEALREALPSPEEKLCTTCNAYHPIDWFHPLMRKR